VLLRTYTALWEHRLVSAPFASALESTALSVPVAIETQGEAVTYSADGRGYVTASEGASPVLHLVTCP
jgi:hypothetical protein